jgi:hypothetical protein
MRWCEWVQGRWRFKTARDWKGTYWTVETDRDGPTGGPVPRLAFLLYRDGRHRDNDAFATLADAQRVVTERSRRALRRPSRARHALAGATAPPVTLNAPRPRNRPGGTDAARFDRRADPIPAAPAARLRQWPTHWPRPGAPRPARLARYAAVPPLRA